MTDQVVSRRPGLSKWIAGAVGLVGPVLAFAGGGTTAAAGAGSDAAIEVAAKSFQASGTAAMVEIGTAIVGVAAVAIVFKWAKGMFFS